MMRSWGTRSFSFTSRRSTGDALLYFTENNYADFSRKDSTLSVLINFEAAFDRISFIAILIKWKKNQTKGKILHYITQFLKDRKIKMKTNSTKSTDVYIENGTPQGSVISSTLFKLVLKSCKIKYHQWILLMIFTDDVTIWTTNTDELVATQILQDAIDRISFGLRNEGCWYQHQKPNLRFLLEDIRWKSINQIYRERDFRCHTTPT